MVDLIDSPITPMAIDDDIPFLANYFPSMFAKALIPVNLRKWPSYVAGSVMACDMPEFGDKIQTPVNNLIVAKEYLETAKSDIQWRHRFWQLSQDTFSINGACEMGGDVGSFGAGATANKIADRYMNEMFETEATLRKSEALNQRIFEQFAQEKGKNPSMVRGTGIIRQFRKWSKLRISCSDSKKFIEINGKRKK